MSNLKLLGLKGGANGLGAVLGGRGSHGYPGRGAIMHAVVISTACYTTADSVDMLGNLVKGYFVHLFVPFSLVSIIIRKKTKIIYGENKCRFTQ